MSVDGKVEKELTSAGDTVVHMGEKHFKHLVVLLGIVVLTYLGYSGLLEKIINLIFQGHVTEISKQYLDSAAEHTEEILLTVSALKVMLAVVQSSTGGISFIVDVDVQLGQAVSVLAELVNFSWYVALSSLFSIKGLKLLLDLAQTGFTPLFTISSALLGFSYAIAPHSAKIGLFFSHLARSGLFLTITLCMAIPISIYVSASLSQNSSIDTHTSLVSSYQGVSDTLQALSSSESLRDQVRATVGNLSTTQGEISEKSVQYSNISMRHAIISTTEYFLTPLLLFLGFGLLINSVLLRLWTH